MIWGLQLKKDNNNKYLTFNTNFNIQRSVQMTWIRHKWRFFGISLAIFTMNKLVICYPARIIFRSIFWRFFGRFLGRFLGNFLVTFNQINSFNLGLQALYETMFRNYGILVGQVLVTKSDFYNEQTRNQLFATLQELMALNIIPIINTNDAVSPPPQKDEDEMGILGIKVILRR